MKQFFILLLIGSIFFSCDDRSQINVISGTLFEECETVLINRELALKANEGGSFSNLSILGSAITDVNGTFNFTYELDEEATGTGELILITDEGFQTLVEEVELNEDVSVTLYERDTILITVTLEGNRDFSPLDTLFYGYNGTEEEFNSVQPSNGVLMRIETTIQELIENTTSPRIYYGIGRSAFSEARSQPEEAIRSIALTIGPCNLTDTATIVVN